YPLVGTLPLEVFSEVFSELQSGTSARKTSRGGTRDRLKNIKLCLMEAKSDREREFMKKAATMVLLETRGMAYCCFGGCIAVESSFAQHCLTLLSTMHLQVLETDAYRVLPSPGDQEVQQCLLRMSTWVDMAKAVVEAEFPYFLVVTDSLPLLWQMRRTPWQTWQ
ncbi:MAG: hypothetical protein ACKPKO_41220, partial [Candidatus Fonsibacter sp.]